MPREDCVALQENDRTGGNRRHGAFTLSVNATAEWCKWTVDEAKLALRGDRSHPATDPFWNGVSRVTAKRMKPKRAAVLPHDSRLISYDVSVDRPVC